METVEKIKELAQKVCTDRGIDLFDVELLGSGKRMLLRVFIDCETGISVEDCANVSRELSTLLDVMDPFKAAYTLEVSSPGLDRPIRHTGDARTMIGKLVKIKTKTDTGGRRTIRGRLVDIRGEVWVVSTDETEVDVESQSVEKANMIYEFPHQK